MSTPGSINSKNFRECLRTGLHYVLSECQQVHPWGPSGRAHLHNMMLRQKVQSQGSVTRVDKSKDTIAQLFRME